MVVCLKFLLIKLKLVRKFPVCIQLSVSSAPALCNPLYVLIAQRIQILMTPNQMQFCK